MGNPRAGAHRQVPTALLRVQAARVRLSDHHRHRQEGAQAHHAGQVPPLHRQDPHRQLGQGPRREALLCRACAEVERGRARVRKRPSPVGRLAAIIEPIKIAEPSDCLLGRINLFQEKDYRFLRTTQNQISNFELDGHCATIDGKWPCLYLFIQFIINLHSFIHFLKTLNCLKTGKNLFSLWSVSFLTILDCSKRKIPLFCNRAPSECWQQQQQKNEDCLNQQPF